MFKTSFGVFDGNSWEALCQQVFKNKYAKDGYQHIPPSPGDFGLEGFCSSTGLGFQCYCPNKQYTRKELYTLQRDKITADLNKLKTYQTQLQAILGKMQLSVWRFVTPEIDQNALIFHAREKEKEVQSWKLPFVSANFAIELQDADYYLVEINEIRSAAGEALDFETTPAELAELFEAQEVYEQNVTRKCNARLTSKEGSPNHGALVALLHQETLASFLGAEGYFRQISKSAPALYFRLARLITEFERHVVVTGATWSGTPEELTRTVKGELEERLTRQLGPEVSETTASKIARHMVARWLAICTLDYD